MDIIHELMLDIDGFYSEDPEKKGHSPGGTYISENTYGHKNFEHFSITVYGFYNMGARSSYDRDGSPFKIVLGLKYELRKNLTIFPKGLMKRMLSVKKRHKKFDSKYTLNGAKREVDKLYGSPELLQKIAERKIYISTKRKDGNTFISLIPNESVTEKEQLETIFNILKEIGSILSQ